MSNRENVARAMKELKGLVAGMIARGRPMTPEEVLTILQEAAADEGGGNKERETMTRLDEVQMVYGDLMEGALLASLKGTVMRVAVGLVNRRDLEARLEKATGRAERQATDITKTGIQIRAYKLVVEELATRLYGRHQEHKETVEELYADSVVKVVEGMLNAGATIHPDAIPRVRTKREGVQVPKAQGGGPAPGSGGPDPVLGDQGVKADPIIVADLTLEGVPNAG